MFTRAADAAAGQERTVLPERQRPVARRVPERDRLLGDVLHHLEPDPIVQLVHGRNIVAGLPWTAALQHENRKRRARRELLGHQEAGPPPTDDHGVDFRKPLHASSSPGFTFRPMIC